MTAPTPDESVTAPRTGVLFVCTGNICRSPLAEAIFRHLAGQRRVVEMFDIASCGTGSWHAGENADPRTLAVAARYGIPMRHVARQLNPVLDFARYPWILAMDHSHIRSMMHRGNQKARIHLIREFDPVLSGVTGTDLDVPDPYYGGEDGFEHMYQMLDRACRGLLDRLMTG